MTQLEFVLPAIDQIEKRLESIESSLQQIQKDKGPQSTRLLTTEEVAKLLQFTPRHIRNLRDRGDLPFIQRGRAVRYKPEDVQAFIDEHYVSITNYGRSE